MKRDKLDNINFIINNILTLRDINKWEENDLIPVRNKW